MPAGCAIGNGHLDAMHAETLSALGGRTGRCVMANHLRFASGTCVRQMDLGSPDFFTRNPRNHQFMWAWGTQFCPLRDLSEIGIPKPPEVLPTRGTPSCGIVGPGWISNAKKSKLGEVNKPVLPSSGRSQPQQCQSMRDGISKFETRPLTQCTFHPQVQKQIVLQLTYQPTKQPNQGCRWQG